MDIAETVALYVRYGAEAVLVAGLAFTVVVLWRALIASQAREREVGDRASQVSREFRETISLLMAGTGKRRR